MDDPIVKRPEPEDVLNDRERIALIAYRRGPAMRLSAETQIKLYSLFLSGHSCSEIQELNKAFSLGQILVARMEGEWDRRRKEHLDSLFENVRSRVQQTTLESVSFIADQIAAVHKMHGDKAKKYLVSGDPKDFDDFGAGDIKGYKVLIEALQKITGTEKAGTEVNVINRIEKDVSVQNKPLSSGQAAEIVRQANERKKLK